MYNPELPVNIKIERVKMTIEKQAEKRLSPRIPKQNSKIATLPANKTVMKTERSPARANRERLQSTKVEKAIKKNDSISPSR